MSNAQPLTGTNQQTEDTLKRIDQSWNNLLDALDGIPAEAAEEPGACGEWSVKDLVGHVAYWASHVGPIAIKRASETAVTAEASSDDSAGNVDFQPINEEVAAKNANRSYDELTRELHQTHEQMVDTIRSLPSLDPDWIAGDSFEHYDEHAAEIRQWRSQRGT